DVFDKSSPEAWDHFACQSMLGAVLTARGRYDEGESLLLSGYAGMSGKQPAKIVPSRFTLKQAGGAIVDLYQHWGKPDKAGEWSNRLRAVQPARESGKK